LRHDKKGINKTIVHLSYLLKNNPGKITLQTKINYFKNNKQRCRYSEIAEANLPIGSGIVGATCKTFRYVLKRTRWPAILTFRALLQSNLFDRGWKMLSAVYCTEVQPPKNIIVFPWKHKKSSVSDLHPSV